MYEVLFYCGDGTIPAYYLIDGIEGETIEDALRDKLASITWLVREMFHLEKDFPERKIYDALFVVKEDGLTSIRYAT
ncbi:MAG: hypothetical protein ACETWQ_08580 [Phycisphaerae bacterium]